MSRKKQHKKHKKVFPNNWAYIQKLKPKHFNTYTFAELMDGLVNHWELLPGIQLVARAEHLTTGKIKEFTFLSPYEVKSFFKRVKKSGEPYHVHCFDPHQSFTAVFNDD
jgi:hypothetical protein